jgi:chloride channel protein, CIC family
MTRVKPSQELGDFATTLRVLPISLMAIAIGLISSGVAWFLLKLIGLFTNLFYYPRVDTALSSPAGNHLGVVAVAVPVIGSLIMARYGSERIRGHGIPEAIESILMNGSRVHPRLAILKPLSAAISIGSGGPFGAEGPIIMTGGAFGSMTAQFFHLTSAERKTLLVAGAAAGMSATFAAPLSAVLVAVELLLFEWKPRSAIPVAFSQCYRRRCPSLSLGAWAIVSCSVASRIHRAGRIDWLRHHWHCRRRALCTAYSRSLCGRRFFPETAYSLDVVASYRRRVCWHRRAHIPSGLGSWV